MTKVELVGVLDVVVIFMRLMVVRMLLVLVVIVMGTEMIGGWCCFFGISYYVSVVLSMFCLL